MPNPGGSSSTNAAPTAGRTAAASTARDNLRGGIGGGGARTFGDILSKALANPTRR